MTIHIMSMGGGSPAWCIESATQESHSGLVTFCDDSTNAVSAMSVTSPASPLKPSTRAQQTMDYAMLHYEDLLRRLAD